MGRWGASFVVALVGNIVAADYSCSPDTLKALSALYFGAGGEWWEYDNWLKSSKDPCDGITI